MAYFDRYGADITDEAIACTESVTINATTYYRGRAAQLAALSVLGSTSPTYGVWTAASMGGTRLTVVAAPGVPASSSEIAWDCVAGWLYSTISRTVYGRYRAHGTFSPTTTDVAAKQPLDATLTALAGVTTAADKLIYATGSDTFSTTDLPEFGRTLIANASAADARTDLGLGTMAVEATGDWLSKAGNLSGLASAATSRTNLGLGSGDSPTFDAPTVDRLKVGAGTLASPAINGGVANAATGINLPAANQVGLVCNAVQRLLATTSGVDVVGQLTASAGSASAPAYAFASDINTGMYQYAADQIGFAQNGANVAYFDTSGRLNLPNVLLLSSAVRAPSGSAAAPSFTYGAENSTGHYRIGASQVGLSLGGTLRHSWDASGWYFGAIGTTIGARFGSGSPEGVVSAPVGSTYHRSDGGAATSYYVKESGTGNTGWVAK